MSQLHDEIRARLGRPMPQFWKTLQKRSAATAVALGGLTVTVASFSSFPPVLATAISYAAAFFGGLSAMCLLAVDDPSALPTAQPGPPAQPTQPDNGLPNAPQL